MSASDPHEQAKLFVLQLLPTSGVVSEDQIRTAIEDVVQLLRQRDPDAIFDIERLYRDLEFALNILQADSLSLDDPSGHLDWLPTRQDEIDWRFWDRYLRYVREHEGLPPM